MLKILHKHYNYLQSILEQKLFTKDIENAKQRGLVRKDLVVFQLGGGAQSFVSVWKIV